MPLIGVAITAVIMLQPTRGVASDSGPIDDVNALLVAIDSVGEGLDVIDSEEAVDAPINLLLGLVGTFCEPSPSAPTKSGEFTVEGVSQAFCDDYVEAVGAAARLQIKTAGVWKPYGEVSEPAARGGATHSPPATASQACKTGKKSYRTKGTGAYVRSEGGDVKPTRIIRSGPSSIYCPAPAVLGEEDNPSDP